MRPGLHPAHQRRPLRPEPIAQPGRTWAHGLGLLILPCLASFPVALGQELESAFPAADLPAQRELPADGETPSKYAATLLDAMPDPGTTNARRFGPGDEGGSPGGAGRHWPGDAQPGEDHTSRRSDPLRQNARRHAPREPAIVIESPLMPAALEGRVPEGLGGMVVSGTDPSGSSALFSVETLAFPSSGALVQVEPLVPHDQALAGRITPVVPTRSSSVERILIPRAAGISPAAGGKPCASPSTGSPVRVSSTPAPASLLAAQAASRSPDLRMLEANGGEEANLEVRAAWGDESRRFISGAGPEGEALFSHVVERMGLPALRALSVERLPPDVLHERARSQLARYHSRPFLQVRENTLQTLGLVPEAVKLERAILEDYPRQVLGMYDAEQRVLEISDRLEGLQFNEVFAHEAAHALQDQHFQLESLVSRGNRDEERSRVVRAITEGQATRVARLIAGQPTPTRDERRDAGGWTSSELLSLLRAEAPASLPGALQPEQNRLNHQGTVFLERFEARYGSATGVFYSLPQTTEQLLHFDKYLSREKATPLTLLELPFAVGERWRLVDELTLGELYLALWLGEAPGGPVSSGWGNDRLASFRGEDGQTLIAWRTVWDTEKDAREFAARAQRQISSRLPDADYLRQLPHGLVVARGTQTCAVLQLGTEVRLLLNADRTDTERLLVAAW